MPNYLPYLRKAICPVGVLLIALSPFASACAEEGEESTAKALKLSGFGTLGLSHHHNHDVGVISSFSQKSPAYSGVSANLDTVLGLQLNWQAADATSFALQAVGRAGESMTPQVRMAYVRQQFGPDLSVRVGRYRSPLYFDSDVTEIGYANLTARKPIPVYWISNSVAAVDGADVQWRKTTDNTAWLFHGYAGRSHVKHRFPLVTGDSTLSNIKGVAVTYMLANVSLRASRTWVGKYAMQASQLDQMNAGLQQAAAGLSALSMSPMLPDALRANMASRASAAASYINPLDNQPIYTSLGFNANWGQWSLLGGWVGFHSQSEMIGKYDTYYITVGRSIGDFTPYIELARQRRSSALFNTSALGPTGLSSQLDAGLVQIQGSLSEMSRFADFSTRSASVGVRWDVRENMALKLQYDRFKTPSPYNAAGFATSTLPINNRVHLVSAVLDFIF